MNKKGFGIVDVGFVFAGVFVLIVYWQMYGPVTDLLFPIMDAADNDFVSLGKLGVMLFPIVLGIMFIIIPFLPKQQAYPQFPRSY